MLRLTKRGENVVSGVLVVALTAMMAVLFCAWWGLL